MAAGGEGRAWTSTPRQPSTSIVVAIDTHHFLALLAPGRLQKPGAASAADPAADASDVEALAEAKPSRAPPRGPSTRGRSSGLRAKIDDMRRNGGDTAELARELKRQRQRLLFELAGGRNIVRENAAVDPGALQRARQSAAQRRDELQRRAAAARMELEEQEHLARVSSGRAAVSRAVASELRQRQLREMEHHHRLAAWLVALAMVRATQEYARMVDEGRARGPTVFVARRRHNAATTIQRMARPWIQARGTQRVQAAVTIQQDYRRLRWRVRLLHKAHATTVMSTFLQEISQRPPVVQVVLDFYNRVVQCQRGFRRAHARFRSRLCALLLQWWHAERKGPQRVAPVDQTVRGQPVGAIGASQVRQVPPPLRSRPAREGPSAESPARAASLGSPTSSRRRDKAGAKTGPSKGRRGGSARRGDEGGKAQEVTHGRVPPSDMAEDRRPQAFHCAASVKIAMAARYLHHATRRHAKMVVAHERLIAEAVRTGQFPKGQKAQGDLVQIQRQVAAASLENGSQFALAMEAIARPEVALLPTVTSAVGVTESLLLQQFPRPTLPLLIEPDALQRLMKEARDVCDAEDLPREDSLESWQASLRVADPAFSVGPG